jgi:hypothetical protein
MAEISKESLRDYVLRVLQDLGFSIDEGGTLRNPIGEDKNLLRQLHWPARQLELGNHQAWLHRSLPRLIHFFANGSEVSPEKIEPVLMEVQASWQQDLFRIARLLWSLPFSRGYGRRLRFLIMDQSNGKLIGVLALQSPPLSFPARDRCFHYPPGRKEELVNQTMDIQTLGAIPPYNRLLAGKLVALAAASNEVREAYFRKYSNRTTEMKKRLLPAHLVALTTTSAFGRSSLYNRLKYKNIRIAESLGYTEGYGSFHLEGLYPIFKSFLEGQGISTQGGFGTGPRRKWQTIVRALERLDLSASLLYHGVKREVFLFPLIENLKDYMEGRTSEPEYRDLPFEELSRWWRERWLLPRAERVDGWHSWRREEVGKLLLLSSSIGDGS